MELTPQVLRNAQFRQAFRGYDPDDVDDLLERAAVSLGQILQRLQAAEAAATGAGATVPPAAPAASPEAMDSRQIDEELRRTLQLAQRTADSVVAEANEEAAAKLASADEEAAGLVNEAEAERDRVLTGARSEADRMVQEAQAHRTELLENAEADVAAEADELRGRIATEVEHLQTSRDTLRSDIGALESHLEGRRGQLAAVIDQLQAMLDDPEALRAAEAPEVSPVDLPDELIAVELSRPEVAETEPPESGLVDAAAAELGLGEPAATDAAEIAGSAPEAAAAAPEGVAAAPETDDPPPASPSPPVPTPETAADGPFSPEPFEPAAAAGTIFGAETGADWADAAPSAAEVAANPPVDVAPAPADEVSDGEAAPDLTAAVDRLPRLTPSAPVVPPAGPDASEPAEAPAAEGGMVEEAPRPRSSLFEPPPATSGLDQVPLDELRSLARDIPGNTPPPAPGPVWDDAGGPPTEAVPAVDEADADPFLDELKKAADD